ncbi:MAG: sugar phosphate isomerase/epimerase [Firmicutes bacterium]|jgi:hypothetical protein|nr:sugar phosphate isomerase/epimerase [Bacillota bacterium]
MKIGITFDELLMKHISKEIYLEYIEKNQIKNIELCLHEKILQKNVQKEISLFCDSKKVNNSFHIPHHIDEFAYDLSNFKSEKKLITDNYMLFIKNMEEHLQYNPQSIQKIVIHGGSFKESKSHAMENSKHFIDWFINMTIAKGFNIRLLIETLSPVENSLGNNFEDLINLKDFFNSIHLDICGDIGHLMRYDNFNKLDILDDISHFHIHGYNKTLDLNHIAMSKSDILAEEMIEHVSKDAVLIQEVLYFFAKYNYLDDLGIHKAFGV